jgi:outer membrane biogenesis lipoprotein LolB
MQSQSILTLGAISLVLAACQTPQQAVQSKENLLAAAVFTLQPANTPRRIAAMNKLPPNKFNRQTSGGTVVYVYADPAGCQCVYFGNQTAWSNYRASVFAKQLADEQQMTAMMEHGIDISAEGQGRFRAAP